MRITESCGPHSVSAKVVIKLRKVTHQAFKNTRNLLPIPNIGTVLVITSRVMVLGAVGVADLSRVWPGPELGKPSATVNVGGLHPRSAGTRRASDRGDRDDLDKKMRC